MYFFLSYAREDDREPIRRFYQDLSSYVRDYAGLVAGTEVGFLDVHSVSLGAAWSDRIIRDLSTCATFIALVSPRYVKSVMCGREWSVFAQRLSVVERGGAGPAALLPVQWIIFPQTPLPAVVTERQLDNDRFPEAYGLHGLRQLIRLTKYENEYMEFVDQLARQIVGAAHAAPAARVPALGKPPPFESVPSVFHPGSAEVVEVVPEQRVPLDEPDQRVPIDPGHRSVPIPPPSVNGSRPSGHAVCFVVAAPTADAARMIGRDTRYYGPHATDWRPYVPDLPSTLATFAESIAGQHDFASMVTDLGGLANVLNRGSPAHDLVVFLVDAWATRTDPERSVLRDFDAEPPDGRLPLTGLMIPMSSADVQTRANRDDLEQDLDDVLPTRMAGPDTVLRRSAVADHHLFDGQLREMLEHARNQAFRTRTPRNRPPGRSGERPILQGP